MLGLVEYYEGAFPSAERCLEQALDRYGALDHKPNVAGTVDALGMAASAVGEARRAAFLFGAARALREAIHAPLDDAIDAEDYDRRVAAARAALGDAAFQSAWEEGHAVSTEDTQAFLRALQSASDAQSD